MDHMYEYVDDRVHRIDGAKKTPVEVEETITFDNEIRSGLSRRFASGYRRHKWTVSVDGGVGVPYVCRGENHLLFLSCQDYTIPESLIKVNGMWLVVTRSGGFGSSFRKHLHSLPQGATPLS